MRMFLIRVYVLAPHSGSKFEADLDALMDQLAALDEKDDRRRRQRMPGLWARNWHARGDRCLSKLGPGWGSSRQPGGLGLERVTGIEPA
jgi:hypothetical protein